jgi:hypothetical protein
MGRERKRQKHAQEEKENEAKKGEEGRTEDENIKIYH